VVVQLLDPLDAGVPGGGGQPHVRERDHERDQVEDRRLPAAVDPRQQRHARDAVVDGLDVRPGDIQQRRPPAIDGEPLAAELGHRTLEVGREPCDCEFDVEFQRPVDQPLAVGLQVRELPRDRPLLSRGTAVPGRREFVAQAVEDCLVVLDRVGRLVAEHPPGDVGVGLQREGLDERLAGLLDRRGVLLGQFALQKRVDARAALDKREQVGPLDGDVALLDRLPEVVVGRPLGLADRGVQVRDRVREPVELLVAADPPLVVELRQRVLQGVQIAGWLDVGRPVDPGRRPELVAVVCEKGQRPLGDDAHRVVERVGFDPDIPGDVGPGEGFVEDDDGRVPAGEFRERPGVLDEFDAHLRDGLPGGGVRLCVLGGQTPVAHADGVGRIEWLDVVECVLDVGIGGAFHRRLGERPHLLDPGFGGAGIQRFEPARGVVGDGPLL
jgi:hypothetical protein